MKSDQTRTSIFDVDMERRGANFVPLSPVSFVQRSAIAFPDSPAIISDQEVCTWRHTYSRCSRLANAIRHLGIEKNNTVSVLAQNIPAAVELSYAVPMSGGVLNMINTRLDPAGIAFILEHSECQVFFVDVALIDIAEEAIAKLTKSLQVVLIADPEFSGPHDRRHLSYSAIIDETVEETVTPVLRDEWDAIALNYTSGTTGDPKGVITHHRGAYLNALGNAVEWSMPSHPRYLWTLPLFHCNGWCFPWTLAAKAGANICLRNPTQEHIVAKLEAEKITHMCGAPIILNMLVEELGRMNRTLIEPVEFMTAGAAPPAPILMAAEERNILVTHVYGLTEVYGPAAICAWKDDWNTLSDTERANKKARQGVTYSVQEELSVRDPDTLEPVPRDGATMGEIMFRGNIVMKGYLKNPEATHVALSDGRFRTGDLGVVHPDGHVELMDRSKDIIISGGENISSLEVENAIFKHSAVSLVSVVAGPHTKWGETPYAFVELKDEFEATEAEIIDHCRNLLAHFKCPTRVLFEELPKTATGKIQKYVLRDRCAQIAAAAHEN